MAAAEVRRGRLEVTLVEVPGGTAASRYPKYISVRRNRDRLGKTARTFHCRFGYAVPPMENASVDDVLQVRPSRCMPGIHAPLSLVLLKRAHAGLVGVAQGDQCVICPHQGDEADLLEVSG